MVKRAYGLTSKKFQTGKVNFVLFNLFGFLFYLFCLVSYANSGPRAINEYLINEDANPEIITKKSKKSIEYVQELAIRYLRPRTPPAPGDIIITKEADQTTAPAPPLIIRQQPARADTPEPMVIREAPPRPPVQVGRKVITISGKNIAPPPRKVVIERLAPVPNKPQNVIVERFFSKEEFKQIIN